MGGRRLVGHPDPVAGGHFLRIDGELTQVDIAETTHQKKTREARAFFIGSGSGADLSRLLVHRAGCRHRAANRLHRTFDRSP